MAWFDAVTWPRVVVQAQFGATPEGVCVRGTGVRGTNVRGGRAMVQIPADHVRSVSWTRGRDSPIDTATPGTATIVLNNAENKGNGAYDPTNLSGPYIANTLTSNQQGLEAGTTTGWQAGLDTTIANSTAQAFAGTHSLALTKTVGTGTLFAQTPSAGGQLVLASSTCRVLARFRANTTGRTCRVRLAFHTTADVYLPGQDLLSANMTDNSSGWVTAEVTGPSPAQDTHIAVELQVDSGVVGEVHYADEIWVITGSLVDLGAAITIQAERPVGMLYDRFAGEIVDISMDAGWDPTVTLTVADGLEKLGRAQLPVEPAEFSGDTSGQRIGNLAGRAAWPTTARLLDAGQVTLGPTILGASALELMRQVELSEWGLLFVDAHGNLVFYERHRTTTASRSVTVQAALTDTAGASELGMLELTLAKSRERIYNDVHITRDPDPTQDPELTGGSPGDVPVEQVAQDTSSIATFGTLSFPAQVGQLLTNDPDALGLARGLVGLYSRPKPRIREVRVNTLDQRVIDQNLWDVLLRLDLLDRISVRRDYGPNTIGPTELLIQQVTETISSDPPGWDLVFATSEAPPLQHYCVRGEGVRGTDLRGW